MKALRQDRRRAVILLIGCLVVSAGLVLSLPAMAADEDTQASVYLVFDPETGEFVMVHEGQDTGQSGGGADDAASTDAAAAARPDAGTSGDAASAPVNPTLIAGLVAAAVLVAGAAWFRRRRA